MNRAANLLRRLPAVLLLWLLGTVTLAAPPPPSPAPFLWCVHGPEATHYLLGSMHLLPASADSLPDALEQAYDEVDGVVFESDIGALKSRDMQLQLLAAAHRGEPLQKAVGAALYRRVQAQARSVGMPMSLCDDYAPWFCAMSLDVYGYRRIGFSDEYGVDEHFYGEAVTDGKTVSWLEPPAQHMALFTAMDAAQSRMMLNAELDETDIASDLPASLYRAWRYDDTARVAALDQQMRAHYPMLYRRLISARNRAWMPQLRRLLDGDSPQMIVVGAAHLVGPDGLVGRLRALGYVVTRGLAPQAAPRNVASAAALHTTGLRR